MSDALAQLMRLAGEDARSKVFAGYCEDCGRGMYVQGRGELGQAMGWIQKSTVRQCMTCYGRQWRKKRRAAGMAV